VLPVASLIRQPINNAMLPSLSTEFAAGRLDRVHRLLVNGSSAATLILVPVAGSLFVLAPDIVALIYTEQYMAAVPAMRMYLVLIMMQSLAVGYAMPILDLGKLAVRVNAFGLVVSIGCSLAGAWWFGLAGAALGSIVAFALSEVINMGAIAKLLGKSFRDMLPLRLMLITAASAGAGLAATLLVDASVSGSAWHTLALKLGLYGSIVAGVFVLGGGVTEIRRARGKGEGGALRGAPARTTQQEGA
jgi:O-antigen/teichoic acid export membrane protein